MKLTDVALLIAVVTSVLFVAACGGGKVGDAQAVAVKEIAPTDTPEPTSTPDAVSIQSSTPPPISMVLEAVSTELLACVQKALGDDQYNAIISGRQDPAAQQLGMVLPCIMEYPQEANAIMEMFGLDIGTIIAASTPTPNTVTQPKLDTPVPTGTPSPPALTPTIIRGNGGGQGKIAFSSERDSVGGLFTMNADGSEQTPIPMNSFAYNADPAWSPDGKLIAFVSQRDGSQGIYVMNADGSDQTRLTDNEAWDASPSWSPDGNRIVFASQRANTKRFTGIHQIYVMNADGSDQIRLTNNDDRWHVSRENPEWSPDGTRIAFDSFHSPLRGVGIYVMNADGSDWVFLTGDRKQEEFNPSWSPDGKLIAYESIGGVDGNDTEIYVMNADGSNHTRLTYNGSSDSLPVWSPDGKRIAYQKGIALDPNKTWEKTYQIYVINADGSDEIPITDVGNSFGPVSWRK